MSSSALRLVSSSGHAGGSLRVHPGQVADEVACASRRLRPVHTYHARVLHSCGAWPQATLHQVSVLYASAVSWDHRECSVVL